VSHAKCAFVLVAALAVLSCTPPGGGTSQDKTLTLVSEAALDGYVTSVSPSSYTGSASGVSVSIGDLANDTDFTRCVVSFNLSTLPAGAQIQSAVLKVYQNADSAGNSYAASPTGLAEVLVDNISYSSFTPDAGLFSADTTGTDIGIGPLATSFSANTWHELDVITSAKDEVNLYHNGRLQFRIYHHYENDNDSVTDTDGWVMGDSSSNQPELVITYR
jgi:hypothetical protein